MDTITKLDFQNVEEVENYALMHEMIPLEFDRVNLSLRKVLRTIEFMKKNQNEVVAIKLERKSETIGIHWGIYKGNRKFHIMGLYIKMSFRSKGLGNKLKVELENSINKGTTITSDVYKNNIIMNDINLKNGFKIQAESDKVNHYFKEV